MSNYIEQPSQSHDKATTLKNALGQDASKPFYIWANDDCANKCDSFVEAKAIRFALFNEGGVSVYIVDADGVEVVDTEIEAHEALAKAGYFVGARSPEVKPEFPGAFMVNDPQDPDGYAIVGDDIASLILEARDQATPGAARSPARCWPPRATWRLWLSFWGTQASIARSGTWTLIRACYRRCLPMRSKRLTICS